MLNPSNNLKSFTIPHDFEELYASKYTIAERYFYFTLRRLKDRSQGESEWFLLHDRPRITDNGTLPGLRTYGLSDRVCKSARKKLKADELIACRYIYGRKGHRIGTEYKLLDDTFAIRDSLRTFFQ